MKERKVHYRPSRVKGYIQCGAVIKRNTRSTVWLDETTCRVCMFSYLAEQAPWAREFLDGLRGALVVAKRRAYVDNETYGAPGYLGDFTDIEARVMAAGPTAFDRVNPDGMPPALVLAMDYGLRGPLGPVAVPATLSEKVDSKEERLGRSLGALLGQECASQELIGEFLTQPAPTGGAVQPVMDNGWPAAQPVRIEPGEVSKDPWNGSEIRHKIRGDF